MCITISQCFLSLCGCVCEHMCTQYFQTGESENTDRKGSVQDSWLWVSQTYHGVFTFGLMCCAGKEKMRMANRRSCNIELCFPAVSGKRALLLRTPRITESRGQRGQGWGTEKWQINKRNFGAGLTWLENIYVAMNHEGAKDKKNPMGPWRRIAKTGKTLKLLDTWGRQTQGHW